MVLWVYLHTYIVSLNVCTSDVGTYVGGAIRCAHFDAGDFFRSKVLRCLLLTLVDAVVIYSSKCEANLEWPDNDQPNFD